VNKEHIKKIVYSLGKLLGLVGLLFVFYKLSQEYTLHEFIEKFSSISPIILPLFILNMLSTLIGIYAWHLMLIHYARKKFPFIDSYYYFSKTEIAKYLPGNIFHFIGRQALASQVGISQVDMAKISVLFTFLLLVATILSSTFFAFLASHIPTYILVLMVLGSIISILVVIYTYKSFPLSKKAKMNIFLALSISLQGMLLGILVMYQTESFDLGLFFQCVSIYIVSWLIGFVTPGASGGLGIREGTFIAISSFLHIAIASEIIIFSVLLIRLVNILIDTMLYISTLLIENKIKYLKR